MEDEYALPANFSTDPNTFQQVLGMYGGPAFVRRRKRIEATQDAIVRELEESFAKNLEIVRLRLGQLLALAGTWERVGDFLAHPGEDLPYLQTLHEKLQPRLRMPLEVALRDELVRGTLAELSEAMVFFNRRWRKRLGEVDLSSLNELREAYNRNYLLEKECAMGSPSAARRGFERLSPWTVFDLLERFPELKLPRLAAKG